MPPIRRGEPDDALAPQVDVVLDVPGRLADLLRIATRSSAWPSSQDGTSAAATAIRSVWWPRLRFTAPCWSKVPPLQLIMGKTRHKNPRSAMRYVKPGAEAIAKVTDVPAPRRRTH